jgi:hypothetical protein
MAMNLLQMTARYGCSAILLRPWSEKAGKNVFGTLFSLPSSLFVLGMTLVELGVKQSLFFFVNNEIRFSELTPNLFLSQTLKNG